jgi:hypothetical protein
VKKFIKYRSACNFLKEDKEGNFVSLIYRSMKSKNIRKEKTKKKAAREGWKEQMKQATKKDKTKENLSGNFGKDFDKREWTW